MLSQHLSQLLFLCSGNYYRSRFAEILFNAEAVQRNLPWRSSSYGLVVDRPNSNHGPISPLVAPALHRRGIEPAPASLTRSPCQVAEHHLAAADRIIAVKEEEHRPLLRQRFPLWEERVLYWHIHDLDRASADDALPALAADVAALLNELSQETP